MKSFEEFLVSYLHEPETFYSIMVTGAWGCGKTFYWKKILKPLIESQKVNQSDDKFHRTMYVTLNGIESTNDLDKLLMLSASELFNKKGFKIAGRLGKAALTIADSTFLGGGLEKVFSKTNFIDLFQFKNVVICFDDLERSLVPPESVLGYINDLVEHNGIKTLILSNESKMDEKTDIYKRIKEKVIGKTIAFVPDTQQIITELINKYQDDQEYVSFLQSKREDFLHIITLSEELNFRTFRQFISDFRRVFNANSHKKAQYVNDYLSKLVITSFAYYVEIKKGNPKLEEISSLLANEYAFHSTVLSSEDDKLPINIFMTTYFRGLKKNIAFSKSVIEYLNTGNLDLSLLTKEFEAVLPQKLSPRDEVIISLLKEYWKLSDTDFCGYIERSNKYISDGDIPSIPLFLQLFNKYELFARDKLIIMSPADILALFSTGLSKYFSGTEYKYYENILTDIEDAEHSRMRGGDSQEYSSFKKLMKDLIEKSKENFYSFKATDLLEIFKTDPNKFITATCYEGDGSLIRIPIYSFLKAEELFELLLNWKNEDLFDYGNRIFNRYDYMGLSYSKEYLHRDYETLQKLLDLVKTYTNGKQISLSIIAFQRLVAALEKILQMLK